MQPDTALFIVRAVVADPAERALFDRWYEDEHLSEASIAFGAARAWRGWSEGDPSVHVAWYEMPSLAAANALPGSPALQGMIVKFDARWQGRVTRTREIVRIAGSWTASGR